MKIGLMCHSTMGGSARIATELSTGLADHGHDVHLFARTPPACLDPARDGPTVHALFPDGRDPNPGNLWTDWPLVELELFRDFLIRNVVDLGLEILHFHYAVPFASVTVEVGEILGAESPALVGTLHGTDVAVQGLDPATGPAISAAVRQLDAVTTVSHAHAAMSGDLLALEEIPEVIPNFIDLSRFHPEVPRNGHHHHRPRVMHVSNFRRVKDTRSLVPIFVRVLEEIDAELWLVGDGPELPEVKRDVHASGISDRIHFLGIRRDVEAQLASADVLLMTSLYESFCLVALEAMACGTPVVAPRVGGLPELVPHGEAGYLFLPGDAQEAAKGVCRILRDAAHHQGLRTAARLTASNFDKEIITLAYESLYGRVLEARELMPMESTT